jgi:hypothetical protein
MRLVHKILENLKKIRTLVIEPGEKDEAIADEKILLPALADWLATSLGDQKTQNRYLAAATVIGTFVWGFGDIVARHAICFLYGPRWV